MLAELAAANAAFDVIKQTLANGKEIYDAGEALAKYFGLKSEIQKKAHEHGYKNDIQAFMAAEQLAAREEELKELMIYQGRGGMWDDWLRFQVEMKRSREQEEKDNRLAKQKRKSMLLNILLWSSIGICTMLVVSSAIYLTLVILKYQ